MNIRSVKSLAFLTILLMPFSPMGSKAQTAHATLAEGLLDIAHNYRLKGQFEKAVESLKHGIAILALEPGEEKHIGRLKIALAQALLRKSFHDNKVDEQAQILYREAQEIAQKIGDEKLLADAIYGSGYYDFERGNEVWDRALIKLNESLAMRKKLGDSRGISQSHFTIGVIHQRRGKLEEADAHFKESLKEARAVRSIYMEAENERHIGYLHYFRGDMEKAMPHFLASLELRRSIGYVDGSIFAAITIGQTLERLGKYLEAIPYLEKSLADAIAINSRAGMARAYSSLGSIYKKLGRLEEAKQNLQQAIEVAQLIGYSSVEQQAGEMLKEIR